MGSTKYKRYLVFQWSQYYPSGGFNDLTGDFDDLDEAIESVGQLGELEYAEIVDLETGSRRYLPDSW